MSCFLDQAIALAVESARTGGGPFGALVVRDGLVLGRGANRVTLDHDPTAHAEVLAIRAACARVGSHALEGAVLYTSCEPCPMCRGAALWARVSEVVFAATRDDAEAAGFDDARLHAELGDPGDGGLLRSRRVEHESSLSPFEAWLENEQRRSY